MGFYAAVLPGMESLGSLHHNKLGRVIKHMNKKKKCWAQVCRFNTSHSMSLSFLIHNITLTLFTELKKLWIWSSSSSCRVFEDTLKLDSSWISLSGRRRRDAASVSADFHSASCLCCLSLEKSKAGPVWCLLLLCEEITSRQLCSVTLVFISTASDRQPGEKLVLHLLSAPFCLLSCRWSAAGHLDPRFKFRNVREQKL